jgi:hypothetical protein
MPGKPLGTEVKPLVSIVIPVHNGSQLVADAIESALAQTSVDKEIIVVDDGSTDDTQGVVSRYEVVLISQPKSGVSAARNAGIAAAQGDYVAFLDHDDILLANALGDSVRVLEANGDAAFSYGQAHYISECGECTGVLRPRHRHTCCRAGVDEIHDILVHGNHIHPSTVVARRACLDDVGVFNTAYHLGEDLDLWVRLAKRYEVVHLAKPLAGIRIHAQQTTVTSGWTQCEAGYTQVLQSLFRDPELGPGIEPLRHAAFCRFYTWLAGQAYQRRQREAVRSYVARAVIAYPKAALSHLGVEWLRLVLLAVLPSPISTLARATKHRLKDRFRRACRRNRLEGIDL